MWVAVVSVDVPDQWRVEHLAPTGQKEVALFSGDDAEARARAYAAWKNRQQIRAV